MRSTGSPRNPPGSPPRARPGQRPAQLGRPVAQVRPPVRHHHPLGPPAQHRLHRRPHLAPPPEEGRAAGRAASSPARRPRAARSASAAAAPAAPLEVARSGRSAISVRLSPVQEHRLGQEPARAPAAARSPRSTPTAACPRARGRCGSRTAAIRRQPRRAPGHRAGKHRLPVAERLPHSRFGSTSAATRPSARISARRPEVSSTGACSHSRPSGSRATVIRVVSGSGPSAVAHPHHRPVDHPDVAAERLQHAERRVRLEPARRAHPPRPGVRAYCALEAGHGAVGRGHAGVGDAVRDHGVDGVPDLGARRRRDGDRRRVHRRDRGALRHAGLLGRAQHRRGRRRRLLGAGGNGDRARSASAQGSSLSLVSPPRRVPHKAMRPRPA